MPIIPVPRMTMFITSRSKFEKSHLLKKDEINIKYMHTYVCMYVYIIWMTRLEFGDLELLRQVPHIATASQLQGSKQAPPWNPKVYYIV